MIRSWLFICVLLLATPPSLVLAQPHIILEQGGLLLSHASEPPPDSAPWQGVTLPDSWPTERYDHSDNGWYRFEIKHSPPNQLWGIYLPRLNMNAAVYFNGELLGDGGSFNEPVARNWSRPLYFHIPAALWHPSDNVLHIRLKSYYGYGVLSDPVIGPDTSLSRLYQAQLFWQVSLAKALFLVLLTISLFMLGIWYKRRKDSMYLWFSLTCFSWALLALNMFIHEIPLSEKWWDTLLYSSTAWWTVFIALFSHRFANIRLPKFEAGYLLWGIGSSLSYVFSEVDMLPRMTAFWQLGSPIIGFTVIVLLLKVWRKTRTRSVAGLAIGIVLTQLAGIFTYLSQAYILPVDSQIIGHILGLTSPLMLVLITWHLTGRFVIALNESESLNAELENRVASKSAELEQSYEQLAQLKQQQAILDERERIRRDLHDDVGAKLLSLTYRSSNEENADIARSALQDLRDVVSRTSKVDLALLDALADWRVECSDRLEAAEIKLHWQQTEQLPDLLLQEQQTMNVGRILREAITNAIRHGKPENIMISINGDDGSINVVIENDGLDYDTARLSHGRGTSNMKSRAELLGGKILWQPRHPSGCRIEWWFPFQHSI